MSLLTGDSYSEHQELPPRSRLIVLMNSLERAQRDVLRFQQDIRQILAVHPELESCVGIKFKRSPRLAVDNTPRRDGCIERYRPRRNLDDEDPDAA